MATDVSAPLPDLDLEAQSILVIDTGDANAVITRLVIHVAQDVPELAQVDAPVTPMFPYAPPA